MKICRYSLESAPNWGVIANERIHALEGDPFAEWAMGDELGPVQDYKLLAPVAPSKILGITHNYPSILEHFGLTDNSAAKWFLKGPNAVIGPGDDIEYPRQVGKVMYEGELAVIIAEPVRNIKAKEAVGAVLGVTCANDISVADWRDPTPNWVQFKSGDSHCPLGPWIDTDVERHLDAVLTTTLNGVNVQTERTSQMIKGVYELVSEISQFLTLMPGDCILTGTPGGIGDLSPGDHVSVCIDGLGALENMVSDALPLRKPSIREWSL